MTREEVCRYMEKSTSEADWNKRCDKIKSKFGGDYPGFWYQAIVMSGLAQRVAESFGGTAEIQIAAL